MFKWIGILASSVAMCGAAVAANTPATNAPPAKVPAANAPATNVPPAKVPAANAPAAKVPPANAPAGKVVVGNVAAGQAKVDAVCAECHPNEDWSDQKPLTVEGKIRNIMAGKKKHKVKIKLTDKEIADISAYWTRQDRG